MDERRLVSCLISGDKGAWNKFVNKYGDTVYKVALSVTNNPSDADDLVQDLFLGLYKNNCQRLAGFQGRSSLKTWLRTVCTRLALDFIESKGRYKRLKERLAEHEYSKMVGKNPHDPELGERIRLALRKLNERDRTLLILFYFEELSYKEISDVMSMPVNSVSPLLIRAKEHLQKLLDATKF